MPFASAPRPLDVVVVEDLDVIRRGLLSLPLTHSASVASVKAFATVEEIDFDAAAPDVVVLDYWLDADRWPSLEHVSVLKTWGAHVLLYTSEESPHLLQQALLAGVTGVCLKRDGIDDLVDAISAVGRGGTVLSSPGARALVEDKALSARLTPVEVETLRAVAYGKTTKEIAVARGVEVSTVDTHIEHIRRKYAESTGAKVNRVTMLREALRDGYLDRRYLGEDPANT